MDVAYTFRKLLEVANLTRVATGDAGHMYNAIHAQCGQRFNSVRSTLSEIIAAKIGPLSESILVHFKEAT